jgi:RNA polymerase sigma factor (sigma-70 family)
VKFPCVELLSEERERELSALVREGDVAARDAMVLANIGLVVIIARRFRWSGMDADDLIQEGVFGLMHAVNKFDGSHGARFSTYAQYWIVDAIQRGIARCGYTIRMPIHIWRLRRRLRRADARSGGRVVSGKEFGVPDEYITLARTFPKVEGTTWEPGNDGFADRFAYYDNEVDSRDESESLRRAVASLPEVERWVVERRYGMRGEWSRSGCCYESLGKTLGVSRDHVRRIESVAIRRLGGLLAS